MKRILSIKAAVVAVVAALLLVSVASAAITNGGFETGDLSGWSVGAPDTVFASTSIDFSGVTIEQYEGEWMGIVATQPSAPAATLTQSFNAQEGDRIEGAAFFYTLLNIECPHQGIQGYGGVRILNAGGAALATVYSRAICQPTSTEWTQWSYTVPAAGTYQVQAFSIVNQTGVGSSVVIGIDAVTQISSPPECASMTFDKTIELGDGGVTFTGTGLREMIIGGSGNDIISGGAGNDCIIGGGGNDTLYGGSGNDRLVGREGNDTLIGDSGKDTAIGGDNTTFDRCNAENETSCES